MFIRYTNTFLLGILIGMLLVKCAPAETRVSALTGLHHDRGYHGATVRFGHDSGLGLRLGGLNAPDKPPAEKFPHLGLAEVDGELCGYTWCFGLGVAYLTKTTYMNGTRWNFGVHGRYIISDHWSLVLDHYSHGRDLGIAKDKSNRGWNLIGVAYAF